MSRQKVNVMKPSAVQHGHISVSVYYRVNTVASQASTLTVVLETPQRLSTMKQTEKTHLDFSK